MARFSVLLLFVCALIALVFAAEADVVSTASVEAPEDMNVQVESAEEAEEPTFLDMDQEIGVDADAEMDADAEVDADAEMDAEDALEAEADLSAEEEAEIDAEINADVDAELDADVEAAVDAELEAEDTEVALLETELYPDRLPAFNPYVAFADPNSPLKQFPLKPTFPEATAVNKMKSKYNGPNVPKIAPLV